jgi:hypothetical protein
MSRSNGIRINRVQDCIGKEIFEIQPVILGGSPIDSDTIFVLAAREMAGQ